MYDNGRTGKTVSCIMHECGCIDDKAFRQMFRNHFGMSPLEYKVKYGVPLANV
ncbi:hypothetical protein SAMN04487996_111230 [Dyadobacter soli]|uniref:HTH araC/xylS-type domain-containing protein n=1 Tax=Dyadobacter soli TaxID=659014 RepID=A0A1G7MD59_9BACT|nr:hypothetical protein SAMN04487996_111230 [Dyadobacter soli]